MTDESRHNANVAGPIACLIGAALVVAVLWVLSLATPPPRPIKLVPMPKPDARKIGFATGRTTGRLVRGFIKGVKESRDEEKRFHEP